jgi:hypothetical protein
MNIVCGLLSDAKEIYWVAIYIHTCPLCGREYDIRADHIALYCPCPDCDVEGEWRTIYLLGGEVGVIDEVAI